MDDQKRQSKIKSSEIIIDFFKVAVLKKGPKDLPKSNLLLAIVILTALFISSINHGLPVAMTETFTVIFITYLLLALRNYQNRYTQTVTALFGGGIVISLVVSMLFFFNDQLPTLIRFIIFFWNLSLITNIIRLSLSANIFFASVISLIYVISVLVMVSVIGPETFPNELK